MAKNFYHCEKCGKRLIERKNNGVWVFLFGRVDSFPVVEMEIFGHIRMRCMSKTCRRANPDHWNVFNLFPTDSTIGAESSSIPARKVS